MKRRLLCLSLAVIIAFSVAGCGEVEENNSAVESSAKGAVANTESVETPPDLPEIEPVPVPEGGWTEETIQDVIYINGNNVHLPCKFEEFGDGFEISIDEYTNFYEDKNYAFVNYKYNDNMIGGLSIDNCTDIDSIQNGNVTSIESVSDYLEDGSNNLVPISVNSVTLGSSKADVEEHLAFDIKELEKNMVYLASSYIGKYHIWCLIENDSVVTLHIQYIENMEVE